MRTLLLLALALAAGCDGDSQVLANGAHEPIGIRDATFVEGALPEDTDAESPLVLNAGGVGAVVTQGVTNITYSGVTSSDAYAVAIAFPALSTGYWVLPVGAPDPTQGDGLLFQATADFSPDVPYGLQQLAFVAVDGGERPGPSYTTTVCVLPEVANNNLAACDPALLPQAAVVSLSWDTSVDLDLVVVTPEGKIVSAKQPTTAVSDTQVIPSELVNDASTGHITRDSNGNCQVDGIHRESLVFVGDPKPGAYRFYAKLSRTCGQAYVNFDLSAYRRVEADDGTFPVERESLGDDVLLASQISLGDALGTYVATVTFPTPEVAP